MNFRFYIDPETNAPHIYKHSVREQEIIDFFTEQSYFENIRSDSSYEAIGRLATGRHLRVAYRRSITNEIFVITAYDIEDKETINFLEDDYESNR